MPPAVTSWLFTFHGYKKRACCPQLTLLVMLPLFTIGSGLSVIKANIIVLGSDMKKHLNNLLSIQCWNLTRKVSPVFQSPLSTTQPSPVPHPLDFSMGVSLKQEKPSPARGLLPSKWIGQYRRNVKISRSNIRASRITPSRVAELRSFSLRGEVSCQSSFTSHSKPICAATVGPDHKWP